MKNGTKTESDLRETLQACAMMFATARDPWCVIGGAALSLYGLDQYPVKDVDIVCSKRDATNIPILQTCTNHADNKSPHFRSELLLNPPIGKIPVEIMAGFQIFSDGSWQMILPFPMREIGINTHKIYVPRRPHLIQIFEHMGRQKDLERANALRHQVNG